MGGAMKHIEKWLFKKSVILPVSLLFLITSLALECKHTRRMSDCNSNDLQTLITPASVTITAGSSQDISIQVSFSSECTNVGKTFSIVLQDYNTSVIFSGRNGVSMNNNSGSCTVVVSAPLEAAAGTYELHLFVTAELKGGGQLEDTESLIVNIIEEPSFSLNIATNWGVAQGLSMTIPEKITRTGGHDADILLSLDRIPEHTSYSYDPNPVTGALLSSQLTLRAEIYAIPGKYSLVAIGSDGAREKFQYFDIFIIEPFKITFSQDTISIARGQSDFLNVHMNRLSIFFDPVFLSVEGAIAGQGTDYVETEFTENPTTESFMRLNLMVGNDVPPGNYILTVKGSVGLLEKSADLKLTVLE